MTNTIPDADALIAKLRTMRDTAIATFGEPSDGYYYGVELAIKVIQDNAQPQAQGDAHRARVAQGLCSPKNPCNSCIALMPIPKPQGGSIHTETTERERGDYYKEKYFALLGSQGDCQAEFEKWFDSTFAGFIDESPYKVALLAWKASRGEKI